MIEFLSLEEFRELPKFKSLNPYKRKSLINIGRVYPTAVFKVDLESEPVFAIPAIDDLLIQSGESYDIKYKFEETLFKLLHKISFYNFCIKIVQKKEKNCVLQFYFLKTSIGLYGLYQFSLKTSIQTPQVIYHQTNISPSIIMREGIKMNYRIDYAKSAPPLVFATTNKGGWYGEYIYTIKTNKQIYIDTNLDWQMRDKRSFLCLKENIEPSEIIEWGRQ